MSFRFIISKAPLQLYNSALVFAPKESLLRQKFSTLSDFSSWIDNPPLVESDWNPRLESFEGHTDRVHGVTFLDNYRLASACRSTIRIWDVASGACLQIIESYMNWVEFSAKGKALTFSNNEFKIWNLDHGECLQTAKIKTIFPRSTTFFSDKLVAFVNMKTIDVWSMEESKWLQTLWPFDASDSDLIKAADYLVNTKISADGQWFAYAIPKSCTIKIMKLGSATVETMTTIQQVPDVFALTLSEDGQYLASISSVSQSENSIKIIIWEVASGHSLGATKTVMDTSFVPLTFSPNNNLIAITGLFDSRFIIWDWKSSTELKILKGNSKIESLAFSPDGAWLATGSSKGPIQIWDLCTSLAEPPKDHNFGAPTVAFMSNGQKLVSSTDLNFNALKIWDTLTGACLQAETTMKITERYHSHFLVASAKNQVLASNALQGGFSVRDLNTGLQSDVPMKQIDSFKSIAISADGERLVTATDTYQQENSTSIAIWDTKTCCCIHEIRQETWPGHCVTAISSDGKQLAFSAGPENSELWNLSTNKRFKIPISCNNKSSISFSENGERLAIVSTPSTISIWDTTTGTCLRSCEGITEPYFSASWRLDSSFANVDFPSDTKSLVQSRDACLTNYSISSDSEWVMKRSEKLLWLPSEYRPGHAAIHESQIAIGSETGHVIILNLPIIADRGEQDEV